MKYIESEPGIDVPVLELTRRNLEALLAKLDDPSSRRTLIDADLRIAVRAVENDDHYKTRPPGLVYMPSSGKVL